VRVKLQRVHVLEIPEPDTQEWKDLIMEFDQVNGTYNTLTWEDVLDGVNLGDDSIAVELASFLVELTYVGEGGKHGEHFVSYGERNTVDGRPVGLEIEMTREAVIKSTEGVEPE
jgi:hypothetical protein